MTKLNINEAKDTKRLQEESLIEYMQSIGYEALYNDSEQLIAFRQPRFDRSGAGRISVATAIKWHNNEAEAIYDFIQNSTVSYSEILNNKYEVVQYMMASLFAGTNRIVKNVKGQWSKKKGLIIQSNVIEFNTRAHYKAYKHLLEDK